MDLFSPSSKRPGYADCLHAFLVRGCHVMSPVDFDLQGDSLVHTQIVCDTAAQKCAPSMRMPKS
jgi:hypothetical protein